MTATSPFLPLEPDRLILEAAECLAIFDRFPVSPGHALVVAKRITLSIYDLDADTQAKLWATVRLVREVLADRYQPAGFNIGVNDGVAAGQSVPHAHIHVIPRYAHDVPDPRGGIRWVIPEKAAYWNDQSPRTEV